MIFPLLLTIAASQCYVVDGDTIRCGSERIRLLGIDAPELHGCPRNRTCAPGGGQDSKRSLERMMGGALRIEPVTRDRYGRVVAQVYAGGRNLSCQQLRAGQAIYKRAWDNGRRLAQECGAAR